MFDRTTVHFAELLGIDPKTLPDIPAVSETKVTIPEWREMEAETAALTDAEYEMLEPFLPPDPIMEGALKNREVIGALLWAQATGRPLTHLPPRYGNSEVVRKRGERLAISGIWDRLLGELDDMQLGEPRRAELRSLCTTQAKRGERIRRRRGALTPLERAGLVGL